MKKSALKKIRSSKRSNMAIAATAALATVPMLSNPASVRAQAPSTPGTMTPRIHTISKQPTYLKYSNVTVKIAGTYSIAGIDGQNIVYRKADGEFFFIDPATGDMKFVSAAEFSKYETVKNTGEYLRKKLPGKMKSGTITVSRIKFDDAWLKGHNEYGSVTFLGEDASGHDVLKTSSGQTVYLDPATGDFVPVSTK